MLSKRICRKCKEEIWKKYYASHNLKWTQERDKKWENNLMYCFASYEWNQRLDVTGEPPEECPYVLEHVMEMQNNAR